jgi:hypothetical protein
MKKLWRTGLLVAAMMGLATAGANAQGQTKELSERSVKVLMQYAWLILPSRFTTPDGKVIEVDKAKKQKETMVPIETAREVIKAGYNSAQAQLCEMWEEQTINFDAMMRAQRAKNKWTDQQLLYLTTLHRMTIHMAAGKLKVTEKDGEQVVNLEPIEPGGDTCNDDKRKRVKELVAQQIDAAKAVMPKKADVQPAAPKAVPASQKK